jgi:polysaccharide chain length determinant protein (PEP-CTERM system associated)
MQAQETYGIVRRPLDLEDYVDLLRRHKAWIIGPLFAMLVVTVVGSYLWPDTFESQASLKVVSPTLDPSLALSPINSQLSDRINSMASTILSRTVLQTIIQSHSLYPKEMGRVPIEDIIEAMKSKIVITPAQVMTSSNGRGTVSAFTIRFSYEDRFKAQKVVGDLVSRFINENQKEKTTGVVQGMNLFRDRLEAAQKDLDAAETKLGQFRAAHQGRLPDQENSVLQQMNSLQTRLSLLNNSLSRSTQDKMMLETNLGVEQERRRSIKEFIEVSEPERAKNERLQEYEREIRKLEDVVSALREQVTEKHPDLIQVRQRLATVKKERDALFKEESAKKADGGTTRKIQDPQAARLAQEHDGNIKRYQAQIEAKNYEIENMNKEAREVAAQVKMLSDRVQGIPLSEKEYSELIRERDVAKERFQQASLSHTKMQSGEEIESRKLGETLEQLDSPLLPQSPSQPKRPLIIGFGAVLGLFVGLVTAGVREVKDTSLKNLKDVRAYTKMTILGSIPLLENDLVVRRRRRIAWLGWTVSVILGIAMMAASVVYYYAKKSQGIN